ALCYHADLVLYTPLDFFSNPTSQEYYQRKLRYMMARWGYSPDVYSIELMSEVNGVGGGATYSEVYKNSDGQVISYEDALNGLAADTSLVEYVKMGLYDSIPTVSRPVIFRWHKLISEYLKQINAAQPHLIAAHYAGEAPFQKANDQALESNYVCSTNSNAWDGTWDLQSIDVLSKSKYGCSKDTYINMSESEYKTYRCNYEHPYLNYVTIDKPVIYAENGSGEDDMELDETQFVKELMTSFFSGHASSGMYWGQLKHHEHWYYFSYLKNFLSQQVFNYSNPESGIWIPNQTDAVEFGSNESHSESISIGRLANGGIGENIDLYFGVIMHKGWNFISNCQLCPILDSDLDTKKNNPVFWPEYLHHCIPIGNEQKIRLENSRFSKRYVIEYFSPSDPIDAINSEVKFSSSLGHLLLEDIPALSLSRPFVFFKAQLLVEQRSDFSNLDDEQLIPEFENNLQARNLDIFSAVNDRFALSPNPSRGILGGSGNVLVKTIEIFNLQSGCISTFHPNTFEVQIDLSYLSPGTYLIRLNQSVVLKWVKI
ncbi:MAG: hypothetical protein RL092_1191, partial [Bacteroidota bacterium]